MTIEIAPDGTHQITIDAPIAVRLAHEADLSELSEMWGPSRAKTQRYVLRGYFDDHRKGVQTCHTAEFNGHLVGQLWSRYRQIDPNISAGRKVVYLHTLVVAPTFRRLGVAEAMTQAASRTAAEHGSEYLAIGVDRPNHYALRLYEKWAFERYYETVDLRGDLIFLRRRLF